MELEVFRTAMTEQLKEQQTTNVLVEELIQQVKDLSQKLESFESKLNAQQVFAPPVNTAPILRIMNDFMDRITKIVAEQPKSIVRQWRLVLFPETNAGHYYKIVFGRLIPWGLLFIGGTYLFTLCRDYIQTSSRISERRYYYEVYQDAWSRLDTALGPIGRKKMQDILQQAVNSQSAK
jgi:hypothetical protein